MLAEEHSAMLTGGDSFCYVNIDPGPGDVGLVALAHHGQYPVYDVRVRLLDADDKRTPTYLDPYPNTLMEKDMGTIAPEPEIVHVVGSVVLPPTAERKQYDVLISTRSTSLSQRIFLQRMNGRWSRAWRVKKSSTGATLLEWADDRFPRDENGKAGFW
jgi:hypothetical protein